MGRLTDPFGIPRRPVAVAAILAVAVAGGLVAASAVLSVRVDGQSMQPTLRAGDRVLLRPFSGSSTPGRFAVVVGRFSRGGPVVVKRVIGLPGDRVEILTPGAGPTRVVVQPAGGTRWLQVDNPAWRAGWGTGVVTCCELSGRASTRAEPQSVPAGMLFVLGDNPADSQDSRTFGWAPISLLDGVVGWRIYPLGDLGRLGGHVSLK